MLYVEKMYYICHVRNKQKMFNNLNNREMEEYCDFDFNGKHQEQTVAALLNDHDMKRILGDLKEILGGTIDGAIYDASIEYERESGYTLSDMYPKDVIEDHKREIAIKWFNKVLDSVEWTD